MTLEEIKAVWKQKLFARLFDTVTVDITENIKEELILLDKTVTESGLNVDLIYFFKEGIPCYKSDIEKMLWIRKWILKIQATRVKWISMPR